MSTNAKKCHVCGEARHEKDSGGFMCDPCRVGLDVDVARVKSLPKRIARAFRSFWKEVASAD